VSTATYTVTGMTCGHCVASVTEEISELAEVDYVVLTSGRADILCEVLCNDSTHLLELVNGRIREIRGVRTVEVSTYLRLLKQTYTWGTG
jgi:Lrp/AsnC family transcriptional regulator for asnA, asnC and gidA